MKKALIIIGAVFAGLALLAIIGSFLPSDEPQQVVIVDPTPAAEAEAPAPATELTSEELRVYRYIDRTFPETERIYARMLKAIERENPADLVACCEQYIRYGKTWERLDWANGEVTDLETAFGEYMEGNRKFYKNWLSGTFGEGNMRQCAANAIKAQDAIEKWAPRVEDRLGELEAEVY